MQIISITIPESDMTTLLASIYKCDPSEVVISTEGTLHAAIQTNLDGIKRAAKILNAGKG